MNKNIAVLSGDGIGPEVMNEAIKVLNKVEEKFEHKFHYVEGLIGGAAWPKFGNHFPEVTRKICEESDAIIFGSVGGPIDQMEDDQWKNCEKNSILGLRKTFQFNANLRPVKVYQKLKLLCPLKEQLIDQGIDILFVRELVGGIYFGEHKTYKENERKASDIMEYSESQIRAIAHVAFRSARSRRNKVHSIDKSNVLDCSRLWKTVVTEVSKEYTNVELNHMLVDNAAMQLIKNPSQFDVVLCPNMFGDILSDAAAVLPGSLGLMPSASLSESGFAMYEPSGGSAPDIAGKGIANPIAQILSAALMLRHSFNLEEEALSIENAVKRCINKGYGTSDISPVKSESKTTSELGDLICQEL
jgi:3-isopropylmalate dehydrogenase